MNYQQMGIWRLADHDEVIMKEHNLIISGNTFAGDFHSNIAPIHICCRKNSTQELWDAEDLENNFIDMKKILHHLSLTKNSRCLFRKTGKGIV